MQAKEAGTKRAGVAGPFSFIEGARRTRTSTACREESDTAEQLTHIHIPILKIITPRIIVKIYMILGVSMNKIFGV